MIKQRFTTTEIKGVNMNPNWGYSKIHKLEQNELTKNVIEDMQTGYISFLLYAFPNSRAKMTQVNGG